MHANLKGGNAAVRLLLAHGEKIGMAGIVICAGMLLYSALSVERLDSDMTPDRLEAAVKTARQKVEGFTWDQVANQNQEAVVIAKKLSVDAIKPIEKSDFPNISPIDRPVIPPMGPRTDPVLLAAADLEVYSDSGLWASGDPAIIKQRQLAALKEAQQEQQAEERARQREERENEDQGYGGRRGRGRGRGRGRDERGPDREEETRNANAPIVVQPRMGVQLQGFEEIKAQAWVTVLAKIPVKEQYQLYEDALGEARGYVPDRDIPQYLGYFVERAEVTNKGQGNWEMIAKVYKGSLQKELATYPVNPPEVVDSRYVHPLLTHPLPPLILKEWDYRASHSSIPLASEAAEMEEEPEQPAEESPDEETGEEDGFGGFAQGLNRRGPGAPNEGGMYGGEREYGGRGAYGGRGGPYGGRGMYGGREGYGGEFGGRGYGGEFGGEMGGYRGYGGEFGGEMGMGYGRGGIGSLGLGSGVVIADFVWDHKTSNVLFRFFDNSVEPGRRYRYRVQLVLRDANDEVSPAYLDRSVIERRSDLTKVRLRVRPTDWSKPSPVVSVPMPAQIYIASAEPAKDSYNSEPEAEIVIKALNSEYAAEIALKESFSRGEVMNLEEKAQVIWSNRYDPEQDPEFEFHTGATVADIRGGQKLSSQNRDLTAPARVVLMDAAGKLTIHQELKDTDAVTEFEQTIEFAKDDRNRGRFGGRGGRGGYGGEF